MSALYHIYKPPVQCAVIYVYICRCARGRLLWRDNSFFFFNEGEDDDDDEVLPRGGKNHVCCSRARSRRNWWVVVRLYRYSNSAQNFGERNVTRCVRQRYNSRVPVGVYRCASFGR